MHSNIDHNSRIVMIGLYGHDLKRKDLGVLLHEMGYEDWAVCIANDIGTDHYDMMYLPQKGDALDHLKGANLIVAHHLYYDNKESRGYFYNKRNNEIVDLAERYQVPLVIFGDFPYRSREPDVKAPNTSLRIYFPKSQQKRNKAKTNPKFMIPGSIEISERPERIDASAPKLSCPLTALRLVSQITKTGTLSYVTQSENRLFVYVEDAQGRGTYLYQSFAGTGGKQQGWWFLSGGTLADRRGRAVWVIKGSPTKDPYEGRSALRKLLEEANQFLPHADSETDDWLREVLSGKSYGDIIHNPAFELKPTLIVHEPMTTPVEVNYWASFAYSTWKTYGITKIFGERDL